MHSLPESQLDEVRKRFRDYLKERGHRQTPERMAILEQIYASPGHFDADELFLRLKQAGSRVSRATVYNTLELLLGCDLVVRHQFGGSQAKFERAFAYWQHDHLICTDCGKILEFCDPRLQGIQDTVGEIFDFDITQHALHIYGRCRRSDCPDRPAESKS